MKAQKATPLHMSFVPTRATDLLELLYSFLKVWQHFTLEDHNVDTL